MSALKLTFAGLSIVVLGVFAVLSTGAGRTPTGTGSGGVDTPSSFREQVSAPVVPGPVVRQAPVPVGQPTMYMGPDRYKDMQAVCTLSAGPGGTVIGSGTYNGAVINVIAVPKQVSGTQIGYVVNILTDDTGATTLGAGTAGTSDGVRYFGSGNGITTVKGLLAGMNFAFVIR